MYLWRPVPTFWRLRYLKSPTDEVRAPPRDVLTIPKPAERNESTRVWDFNRLWIWGIVCSPHQPFSTTPALGEPPLLI